MREYNDWISKLTETWFYRWLWANVIASFIREHWVTFEQAMIAFAFIALATGVGAPIAFTLLGVAAAGMTIRNLYKFIESLCLFWTRKRDEWEGMNWFKKGAKILKWISDFGDIVVPIIVVPACVLGAIATFSGVAAPIAVPILFAIGFGASIVSALLKIPDLINSKEFKDAWTALKSIWSEPGKWAKAGAVWRFAKTCFIGLLPSFLNMGLAGAGLFGVASVLLQGIWSPMTTTGKIVLAAVGGSFGLGAVSSAVKGFLGMKKTLDQESESIALKREMKEFSEIEKALVGTPAEVNQRQNVVVDAAFTVLGNINEQNDPTRAHLQAAIALMIGPYDQHNDVNNVKRLSDETTRMGKVRKKLEESIARRPTPQKRNWLRQVSSAIENLVEFDKETRDNNRMADDGNSTQSRRRAIRDGILTIRERFRNQVVERKDFLKGQTLKMDWTKPDHLFAKISEGAVSTYRRHVQGYDEV